MDQEVTNTVTQNSNSGFNNSSFSNSSNNVPTYTYAGFWWRFLALFIDSLILDFVLLIPYTFLHIFTSTISNRFASLNRTEDIMAIVPNLIAYAGFGIFAFILQTLYFAFFESSKYQGTPGKRLLGIIVTDENGNKINFEKALIRNLSKLISQLTFYIGYIMAAFTQKGQALHDIIAKTLVLKKV